MDGSTVPLFGGFTPQGWVGFFAGVAEALAEAGIDAGPLVASQQTRGEAA